MDGAMISLLKSPAQSELEDKDRIIAYLLEVLEDVRRETVAIDKPSAKSLSAINVMVNKVLEKVKS